MPPSPSTNIAWANLLTGLRLIVLAPCVVAILQGYWWAAAALFTVAALSDYYDGKLARRFNQTSPFGGLFDHATDALFVTACCWAAARTATSFSTADAPVRSARHRPTHRQSSRVLSSPSQRSTAC